MSAGDQADSFFNDTAIALFTAKALRRIFVRYRLPIRGSGERSKDTACDRRRPRGRCTRPSRTRVFESGVNPWRSIRTASCPCSPANKLGRTYVVTENGRLIFKADLMAATSEMAYMEAFMSHLKNAAKVQALAAYHRSVSSFFQSRLRSAFLATRNGTRTPMLRTRRISAF